MFQNTQSTAAANLAARIAEHGDTRMALQRREDNEGRRRQNGRDRPDSGLLFNDETHVSVEALAVFIETLAQRQERAPNRSPAAKPVQEIVMHQAATSANTGNYARPEAMAARAYASASRTQRTQVQPPMEQAVVLESQRPSPAPNAEEATQIARIRENLAALKARKVENLTIQRGETFLSSILESTARALHTQDIPG